MTDDTPKSAPESVRPPVWLPDVALRIAVVAGLGIACFRIAEPFIAILVWSVVLAVILRPLHLRLQGVGLGNGLSALVIGLVGVALVLVPAVAVADSAALSILRLVRMHSQGTLTLPDLPWLQSLPMAGGMLMQQWTDVQSDVTAALVRHAATVQAALLWLGPKAAGLASGILHFIGAVIVAAVLLAYGDGMTRTAQALVHRLSAHPERGDRMIALTIATIRSVVMGVIGIAVVQALLLGVAMFWLKVPFAGLIALVLLVAGIVQIPSQLLTLPIVAWLLVEQGMNPALIFGGWILAVAVIDALLKPLLLGRGLPVPVPVILVGVLGGALALGLIGLFVGPVLFSIGYVLLLEWLEGSDTGARLTLT